MIEFIKKYRQRTIEFPQTIEISKKTYHIEIHFSNKKSSSASIKDDTLIFRLSSLLSKDQIKNHFEALLEKIKKKITTQTKHNKNTNPTKTIKDILSKSKFEFNNNIYQIELTNKIKTAKFNKTNNTFYINYTYTEEVELIKKYIAKVLSKLHLEYIQKYTEQINSKSYKYTIKDISLKYVKSKWGHCTSDNKIMLNLKLLNANKEILDYVIYHEIAHIKYKNHSKEFWKEVQKFCPNYKEIRKQLKENPPHLFK